MGSPVSTYSNLFDRSLQPILVYEPESHYIVDANRAALKLYEYPKEELLRLSILDLLAEEEIEPFLLSHQSLLTTSETIFLGNFKHRMPSGRFIEISMQGYADVVNDKNCIVAFCEVISIADSNENTQQKIQKDESNERFKALVQESFDMIAILDGAGNYKYVSATSSAILGWTPESFLGRNAFEFIHPDDVEKASASLQNIYVEKTIRLEPFRFQNKDKEWRWVDTVLTNMLDNPVVLGIVANSRDVTDKIEERHKLKLLESVITNTKDTVVITHTTLESDQEPVIIYVNQAFTAMTGYEAHEVIGKSTTLFHGPNSDKIELATLAKAVENFEPCEITIINYKKDGTEFWINFSVSPVADETGRYTHWISTQRDVTEQKLIERENELFCAVTKIFKEENNYLLAAQEVCKLISAFGNFDWIELWTSNIDKSKMHLFTHYMPSLEHQELYQSPKTIDLFHIAEGLAGQVWSERKLIYIDEVQNPESFARNTKFSKIGLKSVLGIPLLFNNEVMGVLKIGTTQNSTYLKTYNSLFERLEHFIGAELNRKKLENDLNHLFDAFPDILCLVDFKATFLKINKAGSDVLGYEIEEIIQENFAKFVHPDDKEKLLRHFEAIEKGQKAFDFESRYLTKKGQIIWISWYCTVSFSEELIYITGKNITTEKNLRELNRQAASLARIGNGEINLRNNSIFWSDELHQLYETDPKTFTPTVENSLSFYRADFRPIISAKINKCKKNGENFDFEAVLITSKKKEIWVRIMGIGEFSDGKCIRIYGSVQDINERKEAEIRLQSLADNLPGVVFQYLVFPDGTDALKFVTKGAKDIWGFTAEEVMEDSSLVWKQIEISGDIEKVKQSILDSVLTKNKWSMRWKYIMPSGEVRMHLGNGTPIYLTDGTIVFNSLVLDVTDQADNEQLLEQVSRLAKIGSWEYDFTTDSLYWSEMVHVMAGTTAETFNPEVESSLHFFTESSRSILQSKLLECMKNGVSVDFEAQINSRNQKKKWIRILASAEMQNGRCIRMYGSIQNINRSKSLEIRITEILGSISDGFYAVDNEWKFTYFNKEAQNLLKVSEKDILGKTLWEIFPDVVGTKLDEIYHSVTETNLPETFEFLFDANQKWYEVSAYPSAGGIAVYFKNIDERKTARERFEKLFAEKNRILESIGDVFYAVDNDWNVTYWNHHAEATFNVKKESIIGKNIWEEFPSAIDGIFYKNYLKAMDTQEAINFDTYSPKMEAWYEVSVFPNEEGLSVFLKDITLKKEGNIELLKANERFEKVTEATDDVIWD